MVLRQRCIAPCHCFPIGFLFVESLAFPVGGKGRLPLPVGAALAPQRDRVAAHLSAQQLLEVFQQDAPGYPVYCQVVDHEQQPVPLFSCRQLQQGRIHQPSICYRQAPLVFSCMGCDLRRQFCWGYMLQVIRVQL